MPNATLAEMFLDSARKRFESLKRVGEGALEQVNEADFGWAPNKETNSIRIQVQHLRGNMISRWTDPLTTDGDKPTRDRDGEFIADGFMGRSEIMALWEEGWGVLLAALSALTGDDLTKTIFIRGEAHTVLDAINRQLMHVAYHVGQIVQISKERVGERWRNLSIPRGKSREYTPKEGNTWSAR